MDNKKYNGVLIPANENPYEISFYFKDVENILKTNCANIVDLAYLNHFDYELGIICKDMFDDDDKYNFVASLLYKKASIGGNVIIYDENIDITLDNLSDIFDLANNFDYGKYQHDCNNKFEKNLEELNNEIK
jgi:hypothetical protein